jgi:hypothetical protein
VSVSLFDIVCLLVVIDCYELGLRNEKTTRMGGFQRVRHIADALQNYYDEC